MKPAAANCSMCKKPLPEGSLKYLVTINVVADFDGVLPAEGGIEDLNAFMQSLEREDPKKLERDVYQSLGFMLCAGCKKKFLENPLCAPKEEKTGEPGGRIH